MRILVVDDDESFRSLLQDALSTLLSANQMSFAGDGDEAWWLLTDPNVSFDILILDIGMPRVNGLAVLQRVRQHPRLADLPVVLCTGTSTRQTVTEAARHGVASYIVKPFSPREVVEKIGELIGELKARRRAALD